MWGGLPGVCKVGFSGFSGSWAAKVVPGGVWGFRVLGGQGCARCGLGSRAAKGVQGGVWGFWGVGHCGPAGRA